MPSARPTPQTLPRASRPLPTIRHVNDDLRVLEMLAHIAPVPISAPEHGGWSAPRP
jgi:hypothetical protein